MAKSTELSSLGTRHRRDDLVPEPPDSMLSYGIRGASSRLQIFKTAQAPSLTDMRLFHVGIFLRGLTLVLDAQFGFRTLK